MKTKLLKIYGVLVKTMVTKKHFNRMCTHRGRCLHSPNTIPYLSDILPSKISYPLPGYPTPRKDLIPEDNCYHRCHTSLKETGTRGTLSARKDLIQLAVGNNFKIALYSVRNPAPGYENTYHLIAQ